jgi:hypothetical protein
MFISPDEIANRARAVLTRQFAATSLLCKRVRQAPDQASPLSAFAPAHPARFSAGGFLVKEGEFYARKARSPIDIT